MARYYKLIDAVDSPMTFWVPHQTKTVPKHEYIKLLPGKMYDEYIDDPVFLSAIKDAHRKINHTPQMEAALNECGARYEKTKCIPCSGKKQLDVWFVEVVE